MTLFWIGLFGCQPSKDRPIIVVHTVDGDDDDDHDGDDDDDDDDDDVTETTETLTPPDPLGPQIDEIAVVETDEQLEVSLTTVAGEASLQGGQILVTFDKEELELSIPGDLTSITGGVLSFALDRPRVGECATGLTHDLSFEVRDGANRSSGVVAQQVETSATGIVVDEVGADMGVILGVITARTKVCGTLESTGNDGYDYTGDLDVAIFRVDPTDSWTVRLDWSVSGDWDLYLYEEAYGQYDEINSSAGADLQGPETLTSSLQQGGTYAFEVAGWTGSAGDWTVELR